MRKSALRAGLLAIAAPFLAATAHGDTVIVTNTNNNLAGSLRQSIQDAAPGDTIVFQIPTSDPEYDSSSGVHTVRVSTGELVIDKDLTIDGVGAKIVLRRDGGSGRIFNVAAGIVTIANLTISSGDSRTSTPAGGSGVYNTANLVLRNCTLTNNGAGSELGGAINNAGTLEVTNCTIFNNRALRGSGIYNQGSIFVRNSTIGGNAAGDSFNSPGFDQAAGTARVRSTIIAFNGGDPLGRGNDVSGNFTSEGYNFIGNGTGSTGFGASGSRDQVGTVDEPANPRFIAFGDRGGPAQTLGIASNSPAIDRGSSGGINTDQRGLPRPLDQAAIANAPDGDGSDIGAYEAGLPQTGPTYTVTTTEDRSDPPPVTPAPCTTDDCTLREALEQTNADGDANTINFASGLRGVIAAPTDAFRITNPVTINGPGPRQLGLSGGLARRILVATAPNVVISKLRFEFGFAPAPIPRGGAIYNTSQLTLNDCTIEDSVAAAGGGIWNEATGTLNLYGCTLTGNSNPDEGEGGAINNQGILSALNCTFSDNTSFRGGAINDSGTLTMVNCTLTDNTARLRGGALEVSPNTVAANAIIAGNTAPTAPDVQGTYTSEGHNFIGKSDGSTGFTHGANGDIVGTVASPRDPLLGPLQNNGGPTDTHALLAGSAALNAADDSRAPRVDQRGFSRVGVADTGAFEVGGLPTGLANIATRVSVGTDDNVLIGGFIITGSEQKRVLIRAIGPSLGIAGQLANPQLELFNGAGARVAINDNWQDATNRQEIIDSTIPPNNDLESAVLVNLNPGAYTAVVSGVDRGTGIGLVEVYDLNRAADSRLANISTRGVVQTGDDVMIGGFIIGGGREQRILVRALGPSLPVPLKLSDPVLEIRDGSGTLLVTNDNWRSTQEADIIASGIPPANDLEAAISGGAPAGAYTAIVRGVSGATGVGLIEVYALE